MNRYFIIIIVLLKWAATCVAVEPLSHLGSRGGGDHFYYDPDQWDGTKQVVTKLLKDAETILLVRTSKGEFEVRKDLPNREVFFRFSATREATSPGLRWAVMVDFLQVGDMSAVLMLGDRGYYYVRSSTTPLKLKPPLHFFPEKMLIAGRWVPICSAGPGDFYYPEAHGGIEGGIAKARLKNIDEIEFEKSSENGDSGRKNVYTIREEDLLKNGTKLEHGAIIGVYKRGCIDERDFSKLLQEGIEIKDIKEAVMRFGYSKDEVLKLVSQFGDKELGEKVKQKITTVFVE